MATDVFHIPPGTVPLDTQVAGHTWGENSVGLLKLKEDASVLKPLGKPECGAREIAFYETVQISNDPMISDLKNFIAEYKGNMKIDINERELDFIKLADLTHNMMEPCIMDIKIGKRTWDPLATPEKIAVEKEKYAACKNNLGLCIPGFQIHSIQEIGKLKRFSKEYGKKLTPITFKETLRLFLNFDAGICQPLVDDIYKQLKLILKWSKTQTSLKLYSSSILLVYDSKRLKQYLEDGVANNFRTNNVTPIQNKLPSHVNNKIQHDFISNGFVETNEDNSDEQQESYKNGFKAQNKIEMLNSISKENGYHLDYIDENDDDDRSNTIKRNNDNDDDGDDDDDDDADEEKNKLKSWSHVKMIDFAHAFFNDTDDKTLDTNYLFGIENLVQIFEEFSKEANNI